MGKNDIPFTIRDFLGVNQRDGGERLSDREFARIQNFFRKDKGVLHKVPGASPDLLASQVPGADKITTMWRHTANPAPRSVIYHCIPNATPLPQPTATGLTVTEVVAADGKIFEACAPASRTVKFAHTYIGMGVESVWDTRVRAGFVTPPGPPGSIRAKDQPALQKIVLGASTNKVQVQHPGVFPTGVRAVNVFMSLGDSADSAATELAYAGTLHSPTDVLTLNHSIYDGSYESADAIIQTELKATGVFMPDGKLLPGQYFVSIAWIGTQLGAAYAHTMDGYTMHPSKGVAVMVEPGQNSIEVRHGTANGRMSTAASPTHCYVFLGTRSSNIAPMVFVGIIKPKVGATSEIDPAMLTIKDVPVNMNAQATPGGFDLSCRMSYQPFLGRHGFLVKQDVDRVAPISELFVSRSYFSTIEMDSYLLIRTSQDRVFNGILASTLDVAGNFVTDPIFTYLNGFSFMTNSVNFLQTDGISVGWVGPNFEETAGSAPPKNLRFIFTYKSRLIGIPAFQPNLAYASNANTWWNWSDGGSGGDPIFILIGDGFDGKITACGVASNTTGQNDPKAYLIFFKKNSTHLISGIPDSTTGQGVSSDPISGRIGCSAPSGIFQTKTGIGFVGSDGDIYLVRGGTEPTPIGGRIKKYLAHLTKSDKLMGMVTAVYHKDFVKISYPSSLESTHNDAQFWGDFRTEEGVPIAWDGPHIGANIGQQIVLSGEGDSETRIGAIADGSGTLLLDDESVFTYNGAPIVSVLEWNTRNFKAEMNLKKFLGMFIMALYSTTENHELLIEFWADEEYTQVTKQISVADVNGEELWRSINAIIGPDNLVGCSFKFRITHQNPANFIISAVSVPYRPERRIIV